MPIKPETILRRVRLLPECQSQLYLEFKDWLEDEQDNSERNWLNYFKVLALFSDHIGPKRLEDVTKDDVLSFLDKRKKSIAVDPDKKWVVTWNHCLNRLIGFYRWMHNHPKNTDIEDWETVTARATQGIPMRLPNLTVDMWTIGEEFTEDDEYVSRNLDESYYVWDAINIVHNPFYEFKNDRVGTIFIEYEKIHDQLVLEDEFFCDESFCVNTITIPGFQPWTQSFDYGGGNTICIQVCPTKVRTKSSIWITFFTTNRDN